MGTTLAEGAFPVRLGATELIIILVIALLIFGPSRLPDLGKAIGRTIQNFKSASRDEGDDKDGKDASKDKDKEGKRV